MPSTVIRSANYDAARSELTVVFASGRIYVYSLVPAGVAAAMKTAPSKGAYFNQTIRDRYPCRREKSAGLPSLKDMLSSRDP